MCFLFLCAFLLSSLGWRYHDLNWHGVLPYPTCLKLPTWNLLMLLFSSGIFLRMMLYVPVSLPSFQGLTPCSLTCWWDEWSLRFFLNMLCLCFSNRHDSFSISVFPSIHCVWPSSGRALPFALCHPQHACTVLINFSFLLAGWSIWMLFAGGDNGVRDIYSRLQSLFAPGTTFLHTHILPLRHLLN